MLFVATNGKHIQHRLRRVGMTAITGINDADMRRHMLGNKFGSTTLIMAHHKHIGMHGFKVVQRVEQTFAFGSCRGADIKIHHIGG